MAEYYDGPTSGILRCSQCGAACWFEMIGADDDLDMRIYVVYGLQGKPFDQLAAEFQQLGVLPCPSPSPRPFPSPEREAAFAELLRNIAALAVPIVAVAGGYDPLATDLRLSRASGSRITLPEAVTLLRSGFPTEFCTNFSPWESHYQAGKA